MAILLKEWLPLVLQATKPWISSEDIDRGSLWFSEISKELEATQHGIVCLSAANLQSPWIFFESGALAKRMQ
ncbi:MAG: hypothetical protein ACJATI_001555 [Halioglobus sp.]|jgi:hypothetical protein